MRCLPTTWCTALGSSSSISSTPVTRIQARQNMSNIEEPAGEISSMQDNVSSPDTAGPSTYKAFDLEKQKGEHLLHIPWGKALSFNWRMQGPSFVVATSTFHNHRSLSVLCLQLRRWTACLFEGSSRQPSSIFLSLSYATIFCAQPSTTSRHSCAWTIW